MQVTGCRSRVGTTLCRLMRSSLRPKQIEFEIVQLDVVQRIMERHTTTNILFLDTCRINPLARNLARAMGTRSVEIARGLAPVKHGVGILISLSTQPGNVASDGSGRNLPFADAPVKETRCSGTISLTRM
jgi:uncharacterized caspase-like protein